ncbi:MAG: YceI family protein [Planctomycetota bacterium]
MTRFARRLSAVIATAVALTLTPAVWADAHSDASVYDFKDPKGVNALLIIMDSDLEPIVGMANGISGEVSYDPAKPESLSGSIDLDVQSIQLSNERMTQVMRGAGWINAEAFGTITVTFNEVTGVEEEDGDFFIMVNATLEAMGKTLKKELEIVVNHYEDGAKERGAAESGDILRLGCVFDVTREELGIKPEMGDRVVADIIEISVGIVGYEKVAAEDAAEE